MFTSAVRSVNAEESSDTLSITTGATGAVTVTVTGADVTTGDGGGARAGLGTGGMIFLGATGSGAGDGVSVVAATESVVEAVGTVGAGARSTVTLPEGARMRIPRTKATAMPIYCAIRSSMFIS